MSMRICRSQPKPNESNNGISQKKSKQLGGSWGHTFWEKNLEFLDLSLYPWKFQKILLHPLEIPTLKTKTHGNSTWFFLSPLEIPLLFYFITGISTCSFFIQYPWKFHVFNHPCYLGFFWNSPITEQWLLYSVKNTIKACVPSYIL